MTNSSLNFPTLGQKPCRSPRAGVSILLGLMLMVYVTAAYFQVPVRVAVESLLLTLGLIGVHSVIHIVVSRRIVPFGCLVAVITLGLLVVLYIASACKSPIVGGRKGELAAVTFLGISSLVGGVRAVSGLN